MSARLEIVPAGLLSLDYEVQENGTPVGRIGNRPLHLLEKGMVAANGREYAIVREGAFRASYWLRAADGAMRAKAEQKGFSGSAYRILFGTSQLILRKKTFALRETFLISAASGPAGSLVRESLLSRKMTFELEEAASGLPREIILFMAWIALLIHRKDSAGSAA